MALPDRFTGTDGTALDAYDSTWVDHPAAGFTGVIEIQSNRARLRVSGAAAAVFYYNSAPASADYTVSCLIAKSSNSGNAAGVAGRHSSSANTCYLARVSGSNIELLKVVAGASTTLGSAAHSMTDNVEYTLTLSMVGSAIEARLNGVVMVSVTDTAITATGFMALRFATAASLNVYLDDVNFYKLAGSRARYGIRAGSRA